MFYQSAVGLASVLLFALLKSRDIANKLNKLLRKAYSGVGVKVDNLEVVAEGRMRRKLDAKSL